MSFKKFKEAQSAQVSFSHRDLSKRLPFYTDDSDIGYVC